MLVFLTWSGERSKAVAEVFSSWIQQVIQAVQPWISVDIEKGARWSQEIRQKLEESVGIACLTHESLDARWILFESGAIAKTKDARVCTLLLDIERSDVEPPLGEFQHTTRDKEDILRLCSTINKKVEECGERALSQSRLINTFERYWPDLAGELDKIASQQPPPIARKRPEPDILQEILEIVRGQKRRIDEIETSRTIEEVTHKVEQEMARRSLEPNPLLGAALGAIGPDAGLRTALATMNFDSVLAREVEKYLAKKKVGGILSSDFLRTIEEDQAEDEKNAFARIMAEINKNKNLYARIKAEMDKPKPKGSQDQDEA